MSNETGSDRYDPTTPEELLALARHLAADPKLDAIFRRVGLHKPFNRTPDEYHLVIASRKAFAPQLESRLCSADNHFLAEALARRLHGGLISSDADALAFLSDRIRHVQAESAGSRLLESEIKDIMRNLLDSSFFREFEDYRRRKAEVIKADIDPYENIRAFVDEQVWIYGLGGRGSSQVQRMVLSFLNRLWFDKVPDLSPVTVERMLEAPQGLLLLGDHEQPRKG
ncbi:hypothetical protein CVM73_09270 [Bradyrhizobium forestalis]|uniref:Uncharacterized protein n=1 Tax=Bradyrhizobium forestalis TaxID=1419263 RepID=A0A2M8RBQ4_9BRAD|nr:hypothetical protein [Bradyrhizobium forestalis]PJG55257.1 hypothetical protein CVM73_09270 [Bradyrhizobium forestalis]